MFARRFQVDIVDGDERRPCPIEWLDQFAMRNFTGAAEFDDTLPVADGLLEAGFRVEPARLSAALAEWLNRRGKGAGQATTVELREVRQTGAAVEIADRPRHGQQSERGTQNE
jgi:hypothetical protein